MPFCIPSELQHPSTNTLLYVCHWACFRSHEQPRAPDRRLEEAQRIAFSRSEASQSIAMIPRRLKLLDKAVARGSLPHEIPSVIAGSIKSNVLRHTTDTCQICTARACHVFQKKHRETGEVCRHGHWKKFLQTLFDNGRCLACSLPRGRGAPTMHSTGAG